MSTVRRCAVIGGGVIGAGWAARFLLNGLDVAVHDPHPETPRRTREVLANAERSQERLALVPRGRVGHLHFAGSVAEAVRDADLIQESAPEREALKRDLLREIDASARPEALVCSSTSGLLPSRLQAGMGRPGRFLVAHPFNPVYLLPLVELCGGAATEEAAIEAAHAFYAAIGMKPLRVRKEIDGFIADRLLEALWREALWLVHDGVATTAEVDDAIRFGAGLRWAFMGTFLTYRLAGGEEGMRHFMAQFGPALKLPWTKLTDVPELTDTFVDRITQQSDNQAAGASLRELERKRDDCLVEIMRALRSQDFAAGAVLADHERRLRAEGDAERPPEIGTVSAAPLLLHRSEVDPDWIDYNGHMTESRYLEVFGETTDELLRLVGVDSSYVGSGCSYYTAETHIAHLREARVGEPLHVTTQVLGADEKRIHLFHRLYRTQEEALLASAEQMLLHVDTRAARACPGRPDVLDRIARIAASHRDLPRPEAAGRRIALPPAKAATVRARAAP